MFTPSWNIRMFGFVGPFNSVVIASRIFELGIFAMSSLISFWFAAMKFFEIVSSRSRGASTIRVFSDVAAFPSLSGVSTLSGFMSSYNGISFHSADDFASVPQAVRDEGISDFKASVFVLVSTVTLSTSCRLAPANFSTFWI